MKTRGAHRFQFLAMGLASVCALISLGLHQDVSSLILAAIVVFTFALTWIRERRES